MKRSGADAIARLVLDTSAYSRLRGGHETVLDLVAAADVVMVPTIVLGELEAGFELGSRAKENRMLLAEFLEEPFVSILPVTASVARRYGRALLDFAEPAHPFPRTTFGSPPQRWTVQDTSSRSTRIFAVSRRSIARS